MFKKLILSIIILFIAFVSIAETIEISPSKLKWTNLNDNNVTGYYVYWRQINWSYNDNRRLFVQKTNSQEIEYDLRNIFIYLSNGGYFFAVSAVDSSKNEGRLSLEAYYLLCPHVRDSLPNRQ